MILTKKVELNRRGNSKLKFYKELGYDVESSEFLIKIDHLSKGSNILIDAECDFCKVTNRLSYKDYNRFNKFPIYVCPNCKRKRSNLEKYGVEFVSKLDSSKEKVKKTSLEKWGVDSYTKTVEFLEKIKITNLENWGVENPFQSAEIKEKIKKTNLENWGVDHYSKTEQYIEKVKKTSLKNWNFDHPSKSEDIKLKKRKTSLEKYGYDNPAKSPIVKDRTKKTFNIKWGGFTLCSDILKEKIKKTNLEKWGVDHYSKTEEYVSRTKDSHVRKFGVDHIRKFDLYRYDFKITNDINYIKYLSNSTSLFKCDFGKNHNFEITSSNYLDRKRNSLSLCTVCNPIGDTISIKENELYEFIISHYDGEVIQSYRDRLEIDIYLPDIRIGFEFNGLYYHSNKFKERNYHIDKTDFFRKKGIRIIHIWEDDWVNKRAIIESQIINWLGKSEKRIFARNCNVKEIVDSKEVNEFLEVNHIQGKVASSLKLGLFYKGELVSLMTFDQFEGRNKMELSEWNINRFCNKIKTNVIGGSSKLFKHFMKNYEVKRVISYSDNDWSLGELYEKLGFEIINKGKPDYKYIIGGVRVHKSRFRRSRTGVNESKLNLLKVYDCGKIKWEINI
jgi:transposase-like protein